jgi:hypothetical protein
MLFTWEAKTGLSLSGCHFASLPPHLAFVYINSPPAFFSISHSCIARQTNTSSGAAN